MRYFFKKLSIDRRYHKKRRTGREIRETEIEVRGAYLKADRHNDTSLSRYYEGQLDFIRWLIKGSVLGLLILCSVSAYAQDMEVSVEPLKDGVYSNTVTVSTSATAIPTTAFVGRKSIIIINISANTVYIGDSTVTVSTGYPVYSKQSLSVDLSDSVTLYGIASASSEVRYLEAR